VFDLNSGQAVGLHFSGSFLVTNYAVRADLVKKLLADLRAGRFVGRARRGAEAEGHTAINKELSVPELEDFIAARRTATAPTPSGSQQDLTGILQQLAIVLQNINVAPKTTIPPPAPQQDQAAQLQKVLDFVSGLLGKSQPLGQVNGALGETVGNLLDGKKTAIGILGVLLTAWLSNVPQSTIGFSGMLSTIASSVPGLSGFTMPLFLALSAWGVLGKMEKWAQEKTLAARAWGVLGKMENLPAGTAPPPQLLSIQAPTALIPASSDHRSTQKEDDNVECSVFGPPAAPPGKTILIQVFLHLPEQANRASFLASAMDSSTTLKSTRSLEIQIKRGARVEISLAVNVLIVDEPVQSVTWQGRPVPCQFLLTVPAGTSGQSFFPVVRMSVDGRLVGCIKFHILSDPSAASPQSGPLGDYARRYEYAFVSYATKDRKEVLKRVQMLEIMKTKFFQDLLSLDPGDRWEQKLYENIDRCDLFLLFWSQAAKDSPWVMQEAEYALKQQQQSQDSEPDIVPVILEQNVLPPPSPAALHFNDRIQYLISLMPLAAERRPGSSAK
jgi:hypothetical protein